MARGYFYFLGSVVKFHYLLPLDSPRSSSPQQCQSLSKSVSAVFSNKQTHCELIQRLQKSLDGQQQSAVQEEKMRNKSNIIVKAKAAPIPYTSKKAKENIPARRKSRSQMPKEEDGCLISGPKTPASKALQENEPPQVNARDNQKLSSKEKVNETAQRNLNTLSFETLF